MAGLKAAYIIARKDILYQVEDGDGNVVNFGLADGKKFFKYELAKETAQFEEIIRSSRSTESTLVSQEVRLVIPARLPSIRNEIMAIAHNTVTIICEDRQGVMWLLGRDVGLDLEEGRSKSGKDATDLRGHELIFRGWETALAPAFIFDYTACPAGPWGPEFTTVFLGGTQEGGCGGSFDDIFSYEFEGGGYPTSIGDFTSGDFVSGEFAPIT